MYVDIELLFKQTVGCPIPCLFPLAYSALGLSYYLQPNYHLDLRTFELHHSSWGDFPQLI